MSELINNYSDFQYIQRNVKDKSVRNVYKKSYKITGFCNKKYLRKYNKKCNENKRSIRLINDLKKSSFIRKERSYKLYNQTHLSHLNPELRVSAEEVDPYILSTDEYNFVKNKVMCTCCDCDIVSKLICRKYLGCKYGDGCYCCWSGFD